MRKPSSSVRQKIFDIVGEAGKTRSGEPRQKVLLHCDPGEPVELRREPSNEHDPNAILVLWCDKDIGYIPREAASVLAPEIDSGRPYRAQVHRVAGGVPDYPNYGIEISIAWDGKDCIPFRPLDDRQERSRRGKIGAASRQRDNTGAFAASKSKGCALSLILMTLPIACAAGWIVGSVV